jgi:hypothetical protein
MSAGWVRSVPRAARDLAADRTRCVPDLLGVTLWMPDGRTYVPFRHTRKVEEAWGPGPGAILHPRFALPGFGPAHLRRHQLFRVACILTTPFFVGLDGFRSKLWMVDPGTGDFAGLYEWDDAASARAYAEGLERVLRAIAVEGSVTHDLADAPSVGAYLSSPFRAA